MRKETSIIRGIYVKGAVFFLLLLISFLYIYNLTGWLIHDAEGGYLYEFWRMSKGDIPYKDFYVPEGPLFLFTGYIIFKLFGASLFFVRLITVIFAFFTGYLIFLIGKRVYDYKTGLFGSLLYLSLPVVYLQARICHPETYMVFFSTLGLFMFIKAWQENKKLFFMYSGIFYAASLWFKLWSLLSVVALAGFILYQAFSERKPLAVIKEILLPFSIGFLSLMVFLYIIAYSIVPSFLDCVIGYHIAQPSIFSHHWATTVMRNIKEFIMINNQYGPKYKHTWLIIFSLPLAIRYLFLKKDIKKIFSFYIFSACGVLLLNPYSGETVRYLIYLLPAVVLIFTGSIFPLIQKKRAVLIKICGFMLFAFVAVAVFIPGIIRDIALSGAREGGTLALAKYVREHTAENDYVVSDYGDILFHAKRKTTPLLCGINQAAMGQGITSDKLIRDFNGYSVKMILIHSKGLVPQNLSYFFGTPFSPHHLITLINSRDGFKFMEYLHQHYSLSETFNRSGQIFDIYIKKK